MIKRSIKIAGSIIILFFFGIGVYSLFYPKKVPVPHITTTVNYTKIVDSIKKTLIMPPKVVYIDTTGPEIRYLKPEKIIKYKDSIIYIDSNKVFKTAIPVNEYDTELKSNNAIAELKIITTGTLLDVKGNIIYQEKKTTVERVKTINKNQLYLIGETSIIPRFEEFKLGVDYTIKNKFIIGANAGYNVPYRYGNLNIKIGYKIF